MTLPCFILNRAIIPMYCLLVGGDKPRRYKQSFTEQVGVGFIPTRELTCIDDNYRRKIAQTSTYLLKSHHVCT